MIGPMTCKRIMVLHGNSNLAEHVRSQKSHVFQRQFEVPRAKFRQSRCITFSLIGETLNAISPTIYHTYIYTFLFRLHVWLHRPFSFVEKPNI